jgi:hypothetical protein
MRHALVLKSEPAQQTRSSPGSCKYTEWHGGATKVWYQGKGTGYEGCGVNTEFVGTYWSLTSVTASGNVFHCFSSRIGQRP